MNEIFKYAYEGSFGFNFNIDLIDKYENHTGEYFANYLSNIDLALDKVVASLQEYKIRVVGDVEMSGSQNDMYYLLEDTIQDFDGLIEGFGNRRVALLCEHYIKTNNYDYIGRYGLLKRIYESTDKIMRIRIVLMNYYKEHFVHTDISLISDILKRLEDTIGMKIGVCFPSQKNRMIEIVPIEKFCDTVYAMIEGRQ